MGVKSKRHRDIDIFDGVATSFDGHQAFETEVSGGNKRIKGNHRAGSSDTAQSDDELLQRVEERLEYREVMLARKEGTTEDAARIRDAKVDNVVTKIVLLVLVPALILVLLLLLADISSITPLSEVMTARFFGLVVMTALSYLGCLFIIVAHFLQPELWSVRRQQLMFSSWPGILHYYCILHESSTTDACERTVAMINETAFLMQMTWQVSVAHGVFRYIQFEKPRVTGKMVAVRHAFCWGFPILVTVAVAFLDHGTYHHDVHSQDVLAPWCGMRGDSGVRGFKAAFVHTPHLLGCILYGYFYYYIAAAVDPSGSTTSRVTSRSYDEARISTSAHKALLNASHEKRMLDISRAAIVLRLCMASFMMAYLIQTIACVIVETFRLGSADNFVYLFRIFSVTPQQFVYACVFTNQKPGSIVEHFLQFHTATIQTSGGAILANVNTTVNKFKLDISSAATKDRPQPQSVALAAYSKQESSLDQKQKRQLNADKMSRLKQKSGLPTLYETAKPVLTMLQAMLFVPVSLLIWIPVHFLRTNYSQDLGVILIGLACWAFVMVFPFVYFQGRPDAPETIVSLYVGLVLSLSFVGVYKNRTQTELLVVDGPRETVRITARSCLAYFTLFVELFQFPVLAVNVACLLERYSRSGSASSGRQEWTILDYTIAWTMDDLFDLQYSLAVLAVACWALIFSAAQAIAIVYQQPFDAVIKHMQLAIFCCSGPGYLFVVKNLMKPLFCTSITLDGSGSLVQAEEALVLAADNNTVCWSEVHLDYCVISLFCLCIFCPTATLTNAIKFEPSEDVRYVYLFLRLELLMKSIMVFFALYFAEEQIKALLFLTLGSAAIAAVTFLMQPSNLNHINRLKYLIHATSIWMCLTCMWAVKTDNRDWQRHVYFTLVGWFGCMTIYVLVEISQSRRDVFKKVAGAEVVERCEQEMKSLHHTIVSGVRTWNNQSYILRLFKFARHQHAGVKRKSFETLAVLSYLDQMTEEHSFFAYAPSTAMETLCNAIANSPDESIRSFAIRTLKTFLQEQMYTEEISSILSNRRLKVAEPIADVVVESQQLESKLDAGICLLALCNIDSNQLKHVIRLLPALNEWMQKGSLVAQHLALELIANLSSRFDLSASIIDSRETLSCVFELFTAMDEAVTKVDELPESTEASDFSGFRKGFAQPTKFSNMAHQLPRNVIKDFSSQFPTVRQMLVDMDSSEEFMQVGDIENLGDAGSKAIKGAFSMGTRSLAAGFALTKNLEEAGRKATQASLNAVGDATGANKLLTAVGEATGANKLANVAAGQARIAQSKAQEAAGKTIDVTMAAAERSRQAAMAAGQVGLAVSQAAVASTLNVADAALTGNVDAMRQMGGAALHGDVSGLASREIHSELLSIDIEDFVAWMTTNQVDLVKQIQAKLDKGEIKGVQYVEDRSSSRQIELLFDFIDHDGSGDLDEEEIAEFLESQGLGARHMLEKILLDTGLRQRGMNEATDNTGSVKQAQFRRFLYEGVSKEGSVANRIIDSCFGDSVDAENLSDEHIDRLFQEIDVSGDGSLDADEIAEFLAEKGVGNADDLEDLLMSEMVGRSVTDTVVQMSAKHVGIMKTEMISFALHTIVECASSMSGLGRQRMIEDGVLNLILRGVDTDIPSTLRVVALHGLHALLSNRFSLEDIMADEDFEGYYADMLQLVQEAAASPSLEPVLKFQGLSTLQRRKVHIVAHFAKLHHISSGPPDNRAVTVTPSRSAKHNASVSHKPNSSVEFTNPAWSSDDGESVDREQHRPHMSESVDASVKKRAVKRDKFWDEMSDHDTTSDEEEERQVKKDAFWDEMDDTDTTSDEESGHGAMSRPLSTYDDDWDPRYYSRNRKTIAKSNVIPILCDIVDSGWEVDADTAEAHEAEQRHKVTFCALDVLVLFLKHNGVPEQYQDRVHALCRQNLFHRNIGIAVLAAWGLDTYISRMDHLFERKRGILLFRCSVRKIIMFVLAAQGVAHNELDGGVQTARDALR